MNKFHKFAVTRMLNQILFKNKKLCSKSNKFSRNIRIDIIEIKKLINKKKKMKKMKMEKI